MIDAGDKKKAKDTAATRDPALLKILYDAKMIEPYLLLSAPDCEIAADYAEYCKQLRAQLEPYLSDFMVPPAPVKP
jgi:hypothetical protein